MFTALAIIAALIVAFVALVLTRPNSFRVERSTEIKAPADRIFPMISDLRQFNTWNPFALVDPSTKIAYEGPQAGKGAAYNWESKMMGVGRMEIVEASPSKVVAKLDFIRPMKANNIAEFTLAPQGATTTVTWAMHGPMPLISKAMSLFISFDKMTGGEFEKGLANLKAAAEA